MARTPKPHQRRFLRKHAGREQAFIAWDMRLGKSFTTIRHLEQLPSPPESVLVSVPGPAAYGWARDLEEENVAYADLTGLSVGKAVELVGNELGRGIRWFLCNPEKLHSPGPAPTPSMPERGTSVLARLGWDAVVIDESVGIKNPMTKSTKIALHTLSYARIRMCLSGLPAPERWEEVVTQCIFLHGSFLGCSDYWQFRERYMTKAGHSWVPKRGTNAAIRENFHRVADVLMKKDIGLNTPVEREVLSCRATEKTLAAYRKAEREWVFGEQRTKFATVRRQWALGIASGRAARSPEFDSDHKLNVLRSLLKGEIRPGIKGEPVVVWFTGTRQLRAAGELCRKLGLTARALHGDTPTNDRRRFEQDFGRTFKVALCQTKCCRYGMNLAAADVVIWYTMPWSANEYRQSIERTNLMDKTAPVMHFHLVTRGTLEEEQFERMAEKGLRSSLLLRDLTSKLKEQVECREV